ncbi:MAG: hypothetical protein JWQ73_873 [Variovorax sp.]|nr:hypothetical protein [Variovorax sp.]
MSCMQLTTWFPDFISRSYAGVYEVALPGEQRSELFAYRTGEHWKQAMGTVQRRMQAGKAPSYGQSFVKACVGEVWLSAPKIASIGITLRLPWSSGRLSGPACACGASARGRRR